MKGLNGKDEKISQKMGFDLAKQGLNLKMGFKTKFGLILENQKRE